MGAAYFPRMLAVIMLLLGAAIVFRSFVTEGQHQLHIRPLPVIFVVVGTVFFGLAAARLGGLLTIFGMVVIYSFAYPGRRIRETLFLAIGSAICASVLFIEVLGLPLPMWPRFWGG
jgi:putative tricarboxylic transport membrane protein